MDRPALRRWPSRVTGIDSGSRGAVLLCDNGNPNPAITETL